MGKIYTYDIGTRLRTTLNTSISGYSSISYKIRKPNGSILTKPCTPEDEVNGIIYYDTILDDFDQVGDYAIQAQIVMASGSQFESETKYFKVYDSFK